MDDWNTREAFLWMAKHLPHLGTVETAIRAAFKDADAILPTVKWDNLNGCYFFERWGMYVGVERDGYIHT